MRTFTSTKVLAASLLSVVVACGAPPAPAPSPPSLAVTPPPLASASSPTAPSTRAPPPDPCAPLGPNEVSDDDTPSVAGTSGRTKAGDWLERHGITKAAFRTFVRSRAPGTLEDFDADNIFDGEESGQTLTVGDKSEEALVVTLSQRTSIMRYSALALVVRNKQIVPVLEVGYALPAMDWPDARWLDLQLTFAPGGLEADVHDRAEPGVVLVRPPRECHEHFARYLACEKAHREGSGLEDACPRMGGVGVPPNTFGHLAPTPGASPMGGDRIELKGCAEALPKLDALIKETGGAGPFAAEFRGDRAFAIKSCNARGRWGWKGDRFVRAR